MTEKRYYKKGCEESYYIFDSNTIPEDEFEEDIEYEGYDIFGYSLTGGEIIDLLNENDELKKENQKLKTQLLHGDGVCDICKHEYLVKTGEYYVSECKKGHEECSQIDLAYCGDFEVKECKE